MLSADAITRIAEFHIEQYRERELYLTEFGEDVALRCSLLPMNYTLRYVPGGYKKCERPRPDLVIDFTRAGAIRKSDLVAVAPFIKSCIVTVKQFGVLLSVGLPHAELIHVHIDKLRCIHIVKDRFPALRTIRVTELAEYTKCRLRFAKKSSAYVDVDIEEDYEELVIGTDSKIFDILSMVASMVYIQNRSKGGPDGPRRYIMSHGYDVPHFSVNAENGGVVHSLIMSNPLDRRCRLIDRFSFGAHIQVIHLERVSIIMRDFKFPTTLRELKLINVAYYINASAYIFGPEYTELRSLAITRSGTIHYIHHSVCARLEKYTSDTRFLSSDRMGQMDDHYNNHFPIDYSLFPRLVKYSTNYIDVECYQPPPRTLRALKIDDCYLPTPFLEMYSSLHSLTLVDCEDVDRIPQNMNRLKKLKIIDTSFSCGPTSIPNSINKLHLSGTNMEAEINIEMGGHPRKYIKIVKCPNIRGTIDVRKLDYKKYTLPTIVGSPNIDVLQ
jgi:hypothetical protein